MLNVESVFTLVFGEEGFYYVEDFYDYDSDLHLVFEHSLDSLAVRNL